MALSPSARTELLAEISRLEKHIEHTREMIKALRSVLTLDGPGGAVSELPFPAMPGQEKRPIRVTGKLQNQIVATLRELGQARPAEVADALKKSGFKYSSKKTPFGVTVRNLMATMARAGDLSRDDESRYSVPMAGGTAPQHK
jgi:hypothetical protein